MDKPLWSLRVQAPFGARVLSFVCCAPNDGFGVQSGLVQRVVLYAAAWGSENRTTGLRPGGRRLAVRTAMEHPIGALPRTPFPASRDFPSRGNEGYEGKNRGVICFMYYSSIPPFGGWRHHLARWEACHWILSRLRLLTNPVPLPPPQFGGAAKGKRLNGQARRLTSPHLEVLCRTSTGAL